jgi:hypothetical protein
MLQLKRESGELLCEPVLLQPAADEFALEAMAAAVVSSMRQEDATAVVAATGVNVMVVN